MTWQDFLNQCCSYQGHFSTSLSAFTSCIDAFVTCEQNGSKAPIKPRCARTAHGVHMCPLAPGYVPLPCHAVLAPCAYFPTPVLTHAAAFFSFTLFRLAARSAEADGSLDLRRRQAGRARGRSALRSGRAEAPTSGPGLAPMRTSCLAMCSSWG